jgi:hypothetical protein
MAKKTLLTKKAKLPKKAKKLNPENLFKLPKAPKKSR